MYMFQLEQKYARHGDPEFDYRALRKRLAIGFWIYFALYSCYWGGFWYVSDEKRNMAWVDFATSAYFAFLIVLFIVRGHALTKALSKYAGQDKYDDESAPGVS